MPRAGWVEPERHWRAMLGARVGVEHVFAFAELVRLLALYARAWSCLSDVHTIGSGQTYPMSRSVFTGLRVASSPSRLKPVRLVLPSKSIRIGATLATHAPM